MKVRYRRLGHRRVLGSLEISTSTPGVVITTAEGVDRADALSRAAAIAARIADDPVMAVIMPPCVLDDLDALSALAQAAQDGPDALRAAWADVEPGHRDLARALHREATSTEREPWNTEPGARYGVDVVDGRGRQVAGFWDDVKSAASVVGNEAWKQAKAHQKEIAMAAATAALGPAGGLAAGKAMDLITAAQAGSSPARKAIEQVAVKAKQGNPRARTMLAVIRRVATHDAAVARDHRAAAQPDNVPDDVPPDDLHDDDARENESTPAPDDDNGALDSGGTP